MKSSMTHPQFSSPRRRHRGRHKERRCSSSPPPVTVLFLQSPSSHQLLQQWTYFHLEDAAGEERGALEAREGEVLHLRRHRPRKLEKDKVSITEDHLQKEARSSVSSVDSFHSAASSLPPSSNTYLSVSSSLRTSLGSGRLWRTPQIRVNSESEASQESEGREESEEEEEEEEVHESPSPSPPSLASPMYLGSRHLDLEEGPVVLHLYSEDHLSSGDHHVHHGGALAQVDMLGLVVEGEAELAATLGTPTGLAAYLATYWTGFFPLLVLQLVGEEAEPVASVGPRDAAILGEMGRLVHRVVVGPGRAEREWGLEAVARFVVHCSLCRVGGSLGGGE